MKSLLLSTVAFLSLTGVAMAADVGPSPTTSPVAVTPDAPAPWTGPYVGAFGGGGWGSTSITTVAPGPAQDFEIDPRGYFGGGRIGYDIQLGALVFGGVADIALANINGTVAVDGPAATGETDYRWIATMRGRAGVALGDKFLVYADAGFAAARETVILDGPTPLTETSEANRNGWVWGVGAELRLGDRVSLFAEYSRINFANTSFLNTGGGPNDKVFLQNDALRIVSAGLNIRF